jgi:uncharacterized protein (UPF0332 family)
MSLHQDLLQHAERLAKLDPHRPKQVNLRRAVSAAYYALFHLLTAATSALYAGELGLAARINRTLNHRDMKKASQMIGNDRLPRALQPPGGGYKTPVDLKAVADAFVMLQQWRHDADYDLSKKFSRRQVLALIEKSREAFQAWEKAKRADEAKVYLACFQLWKQWDEEPR